VFPEAEGHEEGRSVYIPALFTRAYLSLPVWLPVLWLSLLPLWLDLLLLWLVLLVLGLGLLVFWLALLRLLLDLLLVLVLFFLHHLHLEHERVLFPPGLPDLLVPLRGLSGIDVLQRSGHLAPNAAASVRIVGVGPIDCL
jgi:hypothetical protein